MGAKTINFLKENGLVFLVGIVASLTTIIYFVRFHGELSEDQSVYGTFGDYIGGVLGTLLTLISIIYIYKTYKSQLGIAAQQQKLLELQQFETTFFNLLNNQRSILMTSSGRFYDMTKIPYDKIIYKNYQFIKKVVEELKLRMSDFEYDLEYLSADNIEHITERINDYYDNVYKVHCIELGHYFRHLYHLLRYIQDSKIINPKKYSDIVQAQMSNDELFLIFYNAVSKYGNAKTLPLLESFSFLENVRYDEFSYFKKHQELNYPKTNFK